MQYKKPAEVAKSTKTSEEKKIALIFQLFTNSALKFTFFFPFCRNII